MIPYKYLYPSALFFVSIGVYSTNNDMFQVGETVVVGLAGYLLLLLDFHPASILLGFVLGPRFEENFRRSMLISRGDALVFLERPISAFFLFLCAVLILAQIYVRLRKPKAIMAALPALDAIGQDKLAPEREAAGFAPHRFPSIAISTRYGRFAATAFASAGAMSSALSTRTASTPMPAARRTKSSAGPTRSIC